MGKGLDSIGPISTGDEPGLFPAGGKIMDRIDKIYGISDLGNSLYTKSIL